MTTLQSQYTDSIRNSSNETFATYSGQVTPTVSAISKLVFSAISASLLLSSAPINAVQNGISPMMLETLSRTNVLNQAKTGNNKGITMISNAEYQNVMTGADNMNARRQVIKAKINNLGYQKHQLAQSPSFEDNLSEVLHLVHTYETTKIKAKVRKLGYIPHVIEMNDEEV